MSAVVLLAAVVAGEPLLGEVESLLRDVRRELAEQKDIISNLQREVSELKAAAASEGARSPPKASTVGRALQEGSASSTIAGTLEMVGDTLQIAAPTVRLTGSGGSRLHVSAGGVGIGGIDTPLGALHVGAAMLQPESAAWTTDPPGPADLVLGDPSVGWAGGSSGLRRGINNGVELRARQSEWVPLQWNAQLYQSARNQSAPHFPFDFFGNTILQSGDRGRLTIATQDGTLGMPVPRVVVEGGHSSASDQANLGGTAPLTVSPDRLTVRTPLAADAFSGSLSRVGGNGHAIGSGGWSDIFLIGARRGEDSRGVAISSGRSGLFLCHVELVANAGHSTAQHFLFNADSTGMAILRVASSVGGATPGDISMRVVRITNGNERLCLADGATQEGADPTSQCSDATTSFGPPPYKVQASVPAGGRDVWVRCVAIET